MRCRFGLSKSSSQGAQICKTRLATSTGRRPSSRRWSCRLASALLPEAAPARHSKHDLPGVVFQLGQLPVCVFAGPRRQQGVSSIACAPRGCPPATAPAWRAHENRIRLLGSVVGNMAHLWPACAALCTRRGHPRLCGTWSMSVQGMLRHQLARQLLPCCSSWCLMLMFTNCNQMTCSEPALRWQSRGSTFRGQRGRGRLLLRTLTQPSQWQPRMGRRCNMLCRA